ncbi:hypothetical protein MRX96_034016 [Rhipicephalus microplus]
MITTALCHVLLPLVQTICTVAPTEHAPSFHHYPNKIAAPLCLGFAGGTHITILLVDAPALMGFRIERDIVKFANYKEAATIMTALWDQWLHHNAVFHTLVFAVQMITAALCHVLLPFVQMVCTVAPIEHAPSFYHYPNQIAVPLVLASPEERISTP